MTSPLRLSLDGYRQRRDGVEQGSLALVWSVGWLHSQPETVGCRGEDSERDASTVRTFLLCIDG